MVECFPEEEEVASSNLALGTKIGFLVCFLIQLYWVSTESEETMSGNWLKIFVKEVLPVAIVNLQKVGVNISYDPGTSRGYIVTGGLMFECSIWDGESPVYNATCLQLYMSDNGFGDLRDLVIKNLKVIFLTTEKIEGATQ